MDWIKTKATDSKYFNAGALSLLVAELVVLTFIIKFIPYTEIDWVAYMQEVEGVLNGTFDYAHLKGNTGPLVYPAGFVYVFAVFYYLTDHGSDVLTAQWIFAATYLLNLILVLGIYRQLFKTEPYPPYLLLFLGCTAYRVHSIYVLRLFNDPIAMVFLYFAVWLFLNKRWMFGSAIFSLAVSMKMNILLFSPGLLVLFLTYLGLQGTLVQLGVCASIQAIIGAPFILNNSVSYFNGAFNFGRHFLYQWTVNWRMLPEWVFMHRVFHLALLLSQLVVLYAFARKHWIRSGDLKSLVTWKTRAETDVQKQDHPTEIAWVLFTSNLIGMVFSRSLHYQFYVWYFHSLPFLMWSTTLHPIIKVGLLLLLEWSWNVYPSTTFSSMSLNFAHFVMLGALYLRPVKVYPRKQY